MLHGSLYGTRKRETISEQEARNDHPWQVTIIYPYALLRERNCP